MRNRPVIAAFVVALLALGATMSSCSKDKDGGAGGKSPKTTVAGEPHG